MPVSINSKMYKGVLEMTKQHAKLLMDVAKAILILALFLFSIALVNIAFENIGASTAASIFKITANPFVSLFIGLLITAVIQSSSTSTSMIVAAVAVGSLNITHAVPMIMGANIGTTLTSTIVSLGYITKPKVFKKAIAAGTLHDFFNILTALILFPLELQYQFLSHTASYLATLIPIYSTDSTILLPMKIFSEIIDFLILSWINNDIVVLLIAFLSLFMSIKLISKKIFYGLVGDSEERLKQFFFKSQIKSFSWGVFITAIVQSSSLTTSLTVPFVATGKVSLKKAFTFILGSNLGTTLTALLVAIFRSESALAIAIVHLLFNLIGILIFLLFPFFQRIPIFMASGFGRLTIKSRFIGFLYILIIFFLMPFMLIYLSSGNKKDTIITKSERTIENRL